MCDAKNPPDSDFVSVSALILFILYILVITLDLLYRLWISGKYEYQPGRCTILGNACNCHFSLGIFIFLIKITPIGGFEQFTAGLVLSLVPWTLNWCLSTQYTMCNSSSSLMTFLHLQLCFLDVTASFPLLYCILNFCKLQFCNIITSLSGLQNLAVFWIESHTNQHLLNRRLP